MTEGGHYIYKGKYEFEKGILKHEIPGLITTLPDRFLTANQLFIDFCKIVPRKYREDSKEHLNQALFKVIIQFSLFEERSGVVYCH
jgi:hypothetical protein